MNWLLLGGSLAGVLALASIAHWLGLGGDARLDAATARDLIEEQGFEAEELVVDRAGFAALARNKAGQVMIVRRHGAHFVAHPVTGTATARLDHRFLSLGSTTLDLGDDAGIWAAKLRRV